MSVATQVGSDRQLARLLQIGVVLEEVVEARAAEHYHSLSEAEQADLDPDIEHLLEHAAEESAEHRERLETLIAELNAESVPFEEIEQLVAATYDQTSPSDFDGILYDQLHGEETAYKFYDDLITAIEDSERGFGIDRDRLLSELRAIRAEEQEGAQEVADVMEAQGMTAADQYLKAIYLIQELENGPAATGAIADAMDVSPASANEMIGKLEERDLATHEKYQGVDLTDDGIKRARERLQTYCIIERFLANVLDVEEFRMEARQLEAVIDETVAERLDTIIDRRSECPDCFDAEKDACAYLEVEEAPEAGIESAD